MLLKFTLRNGGIFVANMVLIKLSSKVNIFQQEHKLELDSDKRNIHISSMENPSIFI